jgi:hypothetical protein
MASDATEADVIEAYLEMRRAGVGERQAARFMGCSHRDIASYADANPDFALRLEDALAERLERVEGAVWQAGQAGDMTAAAKVLDSHAPDQWIKPTPEMILSVRDDRPLTLDEVRDLKTTLEAAKRQKELRESSIEVDEVDDE